MLHLILVLLSILGAGPTTDHREALTQHVADCLSEEASTEASWVTSVEHQGGDSAERFMDLVAARERRDRAEAALEWYQRMR